MYELEYFIYHLRPYGIHIGNQQLNQDAILYQDAENNQGAT